MWYVIINISNVCRLKLYFTFLSWGHVIGGHRDSRFRRRRRPADERESITRSSISAQQPIFKWPTFLHTQEVRCNLDKLKIRSLSTVELKLSLLHSISS